MNFMVWNLQRRNGEYLLFQRWKAILVSIELSVEVHDTKLRLVESYHSINICEKLGGGYAQKIAEFWSSHVEWYLWAFYQRPFNIVIRFSENVFLKKQEVYKNLS